MRPPLTTGVKTVNTGTYYVSESGGLTGYTPSLACTNKGTAFTPSTNGQVSVAKGDVVVCTFTNYYRELTLTKSATPQFYNKKGDEIAYTITATNTGAATLTNVDISDTLFGDLTGWTCEIDDSSVDLPVPTLAPTKSIVCTYTYTIKEADITSGEVPNTACVVSDELPQADRAKACDDETVLRSNLEITKVADRSYYTDAGQVINYTVTATNAGKAKLTDVDITDSLIPNLNADWLCQINGADPDVTFKVSEARRR